MSESEKRGQRFPFRLRQIVCDTGDRLKVTDVSHGV